MALPAPLLAAADQHSCFTGHYRSDSDVLACTDPIYPVMRLYTVSCGDCLTFHTGIFSSLLPTGMTSVGLADALNAHTRSVRGYVWAKSGYFTAGGGLWICAAYFGDGLFLVDASRNHNGSADLDMLIEAFRRGVLQPDDAGMLDPAHYSVEVGYVNMATPNTRIKSKQDLIASPNYSARPRVGFARVSLLEFLPLTMAVAPPSPAAAPLIAPPIAPLISPSVARPIAPRAIAAPQPPSRKLSIGEICPLCKAEVKERPLFSGTFIGCLC